MMTVSYQLEEADLAAAARYTATHHPAIQGRLFWMQLILALVPGAVVILAAFMRLGFVRPFDMILAVISAGAAYLLAGYFLVRSYVRQALQLSRSEGTGTRNLTLTIVESGIATTSEHGDRMLPWATILRVEQDQRHIYLPLAPTGLLVVPKHAFGDAAAAQAFIEELRAHALVGI